MRTIKKKFPESYNLNIPFELCWPPRKKPLIPGNNIIQGKYIINEEFVNY
jgi:hypothetical protein